MTIRHPTHTLETSEQAGVRFLHFGSEWVQGAMRIARPWALELEYTREMAACLLLRPDSDWPKRILQVGLGAASLTKFWQRHRPMAKQTIIEINPAVVAMAEQSFKLPRAPTRAAQIRFSDSLYCTANVGRCLTAVIARGARSELAPRDLPR